MNNKLNELEELLHSEESNLKKHEETEEIIRSNVVKLLLISLGLFIFGGLFLPILGLAAYITAMIITLPTGIAVLVLEAKQVKCEKNINKLKNEIESLSIEQEDLLIETKKETSIKENKMKSSQMNQINTNIKEQDKNINKSR